MLPLCPANLSLQKPKQMIRVKTEVSYQYEIDLPDYDEETNREMVTRTKTTEYFFGSEGEVNWWLLSMSIRYPNGITEIIKTRAVVL